MTQLASDLEALIQYTLDLLKESLQRFPHDLISLPDDLRDPSDSRRDPALPTTITSTLLSPIIPIMTPLSRPLSARLRTLGLNARPITWPTVPKGKDRVRVCLHAGNSKDEVRRLVEGVVLWAEEEMMERVGERGVQRQGRHGRDHEHEQRPVAGGVVEAKL